MAIAKSRYLIVYSEIPITEGRSSTNGRDSVADLYRLVLAARAKCLNLP